MLMIGNAMEVKRDDLKAIRTPTATSTWRPCGHYEAVQTLIERAEARGMKLRSERYAIMPGRLYPTPGVAVELPGGRMFASLDFEPIPGIELPPGIFPSAGLKNSHDRSTAFSALCGGKLVLCSNGVMVADKIVTRRHTSGLELIASIDAALDEFRASLGRFNDMHAALNNWRLSKTKAHSLVVELARAGAFASSDILPVISEFESPTYPEFRAPTAWHLYQASTEAALKKQSPQRQTEGFKALNSVLMANLN